MLQFKCTEPTPDARKYFVYSRIAQALGMTYNQVQHVCRAALGPKKMPSVGQILHKLGPEHLHFLTSLHTLEEWAGRTMVERTVLFHRQFPNKRIAVTSLRRLYLKNGICCKKIRLIKTLSQRVRLNFVPLCQELLAEIE